MSQTYTDNCFVSSHGVQVDMAIIEQNFAALKSCFSGTSTPANTVAGMWWLDTTNHILKFRNEANTAWLSVWNMTDNKPFIANLLGEITLAMIAASAADPAAGTAGLRTLGTTSLKACAGNDSRLSDNRTPSDTSVSQSKLKDTSGTVSSTSSTGTLVTLPGGTHGFVPQISMNGTIGDFAKIIATDYLMYSVSSAYTSNIVLVGNGCTAYARQYYIQASPPYKIGNQKWGHFLFILRNKSDKKVISSYEAEDPPWAYNGPDWNTKDSKERIQEVPHPFAEYMAKDPGSDGLEVVLVDMRDVDVKQIKTDLHKQGKSFSASVVDFNPKGEVIAPSRVMLPEIIGFTDKIKIQR